VIEVSQNNLSELTEKSNQEVAFTIIESDRAVSKTFGVGPNGAPIAVKGAGVASGTARQVTLSGTAMQALEQLAEKLVALTPNEALILTPPPAGRDEWPVVVKEKVNGRNDVIARSKAFFQHQPGPALLSLDFDVKGYPAHILGRLKHEDTGGVSGALAAVFPAIADAAYVTRPSVSCGIVNQATGQATDRSSGFHRYFVAADGRDIAGFAKRLGDHLMLGGWVWGDVSESGSILHRTLIDVGATCGPERLWYEANAVFSDANLAYVEGAREPRCFEGGVLTTSALPELTAEETTRLVQMKGKIAAELAAEAKAVRDAWLVKRGKSLRERGVTPERVRQVLADAVDNFILSGDIQIQLDDGTMPTVAEILRDPGRYDGATCADPLEPDYHGGQNVGVIYTYGRPIIFSQAHGGVTYTLVAPEIWFEHIASADDTDPDAWPEPVDLFGDGDPSALRDVPTGALPDVLDRYVRDEAARMGASEAFFAIGAVVTASGAIGGKVRIQPTANNTGWTLPAFFWGALVEKPGGKKSPVLKEVTKPLRNVDGRWARIDIPKRQAWDVASRKRKKDETVAGPRPRIRRALVNAFTLEGMRDVLADNPYGVLAAVDEATGLVCGLDQYKAHGGSDRADLLELVDGNERTIDRVGRTIRCECWGAAVLGGFQPAKIREMAKNLSPDGLLQRFIPVVGDGVRHEGVDRAPDEAAVRGYTSAIETLAETTDFGTIFDPAVITLSGEAQAIRQKFERRLDTLLDLPDVSDAWCNHISKWSGNFARLLLIFHMLERGPSGALVPVAGDTAERAWRFAQFLLVHAIHFYEQTIGRGFAGEAAHVAAGLVLTSEKSTITARDLYRRHRAWRDGEASQELFDGMKVLCRLGWCRPEGGGWRVNPLVFERFANQSASVKERFRLMHERLQNAFAERRVLKATLRDGANQ